MIEKNVVHIPLLEPIENQCRVSVWDSPFFNQFKGNTLPWIISPKNISEPKLVQTPPQESASWMQTAAGELGVKEKTGNNDGPDVEKYLKTVRAKSGDAWCAAFVNWVLEQNNLKGTGSSTAYSYDSYGVELFKPAYGSIAVMKYSHVGFVAGLNSDGRIILLGGNQGKPGSVNLSPNSVKDVKSYRYPAGFTPDYTLPPYSLKGKSLDFNSSH